MSKSYYNLHWLILDAEPEQVARIDYMKSTCYVWEDRLFFKHREDAESPLMLMEYDISDPSQPIELSQYEIDYEGRHQFVDPVGYWQEHLYLANQSGPGEDDPEIIVLDYSGEGAPELAGRFPLPSFDYYGGYKYLTPLIHNGMLYNKCNGILDLYRLENVISPELVQTNWIQRGNYSMQIERNHLYLHFPSDPIYADPEEEILIYNLQPDSLTAGSAKERFLPPQSPALSAFPNPFNSSVTITFSTGIPPSIEGGRGGLSLKIYDLSGRLVADLTHSAFRIPHSAFGKVTWDASSIGAGIYFVRLEAGEEVRTQKIVLMR